MQPLTDGSLRWLVWPMQSNIFSLLNSVVGVELLNAALHTLCMALD